MDHFQGITPEERYKNDVLNELRTMNELLAQLLGHNAQMSENPKPRGRKKAS